MATFDTEDFLAHYGVKGMKWGVTRAAPEVRVARKAARKQARRDLDTVMAVNEIKRREAASTMTSGKKFLSDMGAVGSAYTGTSISRAAGYSRGQAKVISILGGGPLYGPLTAGVAAELKIRKDVRSSIR
ncbi:gp015 [Rhodococcus phage ReqiPepy6]|uniref:Gp015 n=1 Tax=Rhodococcus phage ReqiPepy6 TaxID=691965 RepID=D4P7C6_9CAUD|nr:gp015 [Rhodococcus phage ReqiPepy6]ADD80906.1 gp015 [Rhodococcus phage ReqiPepy6]